MNWSPDSHFCITSRRLIGTVISRLKSTHTHTHTSRRGLFMLLFISPAASCQRWSFPTWQRSYSNVIIQSEDRRANRSNSFPPAVSLVVESFCPRRSDTQNSLSHLDPENVFLLDAVWGKKFTSDFSFTAFSFCSLKYMFIYKVLSFLLVALKSCY